MSNRIVFCLALICALVWNSCKEVEPQKDSGYSYFPIQVGSHRLYTLDSIIYTGVSKSKDSSRYFLKEIVVEKVEDSLNKKRYKVETYISKDTLSGWLATGYFFYDAGNDYVNKVEGGIIKTLFIFPVTKGRKWNVNMFTSLETETAVYSMVGKPFQSYNDCSEVVLYDDQNVIEERIDKSIYARNLGLVYKIESDITIDNQTKNGTTVLKSRIY